jgi:phage terminase small subunit
MPRISAEARSAAALREGGQHPKPPECLGRRAKAIWREIVEDRPVDFFRPGARTLLANYCAMAAVQEQNIRTLDEDPLNPEFQRLVRDMSTSLNMTAAKLRLSIQSALRCESGKLDEKEPSTKGRGVKETCCLAETW